MTTLSWERGAAVGEPKKPGITAAGWKICGHVFCCDRSPDPSREGIEGRFHVKPPEATRLLGASGPVSDLCGFEPWTTPSGDNSSWLCALA